MTELRAKRGAGMMRSMDQTHNQIRRHRKPRVGFYGCALKGGRVVRLRSEDGHDKRNMVLTCPACGHQHTVKIFWRAITRFDEGKEADLIV